MRHVENAPSRPSKIVFRIPTIALLAAGLIVVCATPFAFAAPGLQTVYLLPIGYAVWVLRNRTTVDSQQLVARSTFSRRVLPWSEVKAIKVANRSWLSAVRTDDTLVKLPAVRIGHLPALALISGGRIADPTAPTEAPETPEAAAADAEPENAEQP
jgi:hypothetical protein